MFSLGGSFLPMRSLKIDLATLSTHPELVVLVDGGPGHGLHLDHDALLRVARDGVHLGKPVLSSPGARHSNCDPPGVLIFFFGG